MLNFLYMACGLKLRNAGWMATRAVPVAAADGGNVVIGTDPNLGETATTLKGDGTAGVAGAVGQPVPVFAAESNGTVTFSQTGERAL